MLNLTEKEVKLIAQLRENLADLNLSKEFSSDMIFVRFLRARDLNLNDAEEMFRKSMKWREEHNVSAILDEWEPPIICRKMTPEDVCGYTPDGLPVLVVPFRFFEVDKFLEFEESVYYRYCVWNVERASAAIKSGRTVENENFQLICIYDVEGLEYKKVILNPHYLTYLQKVTSMIENNYPEILFKGYIVNSPTIFSVIYSMIKLFVSKKTTEKIDLLGSDIGYIKERLSEEIPLEILPSRYGGLNTEFEKVAYAHCDLPQRENEHHRDGTEGGTQCLIPAGQKQDFDYAIDKIGTTLRWEFVTEGYDIGFSVLHPGESSAPCSQRVNSHEKKQTGSIHCTQSGKYSLVFDNSFSRMRSKTLHLFVQILPPFTSD